MQSRSDSRSDFRAFHFALIAFVCLAIGLLSGGSATWPSNERFEPLAASDQAAIPNTYLDIAFADDLPDQLVDTAGPLDEDDRDEDETKHYVLHSDSAAFKSPATLYKSPADRTALTPFRLLAFSNRGSPTA
jgi:hypothetical protein